MICPNPYRRSADTPPWLILNYPFTPSYNSAQEHYSVVFERYMQPEDRAQNYKEGIFVLNAAHIREFFLWFRGALPA
jgi:hypothetical protein